MNITVSFSYEITPQEGTPYAVASAAVDQMYSEYQNLEYIYDLNKVEDAENETITVTGKRDIDLGAI